MTILTDARVVQGDQVVEGGWVRWEGERLAEVGRGHLPLDRRPSAGGRPVVPGFIDIHVHGGGGGSFTTGSAEDGAAVARFHRRHGTTTMLASLYELIDDGLHLHPPLVRWVLGTVGEARAALVSDAIAAAGADDGLYALGRPTVRVRDGRAELVDGSSVAGSTLTTDVAFRRVVQCQGLGVGAAVRAVLYRGSWVDGRTP